MLYRILEGDKHIHVFAMTMILEENKVWIDGCFDFSHHGHAGAILQARRTVAPGAEPTSELYCGVHSDEEILHNKGPPVMHSAERYAHTAASRWCSHMIPDAPYVTEPRVLDSYGCKYVVHGDDITLDANGEDCYQEMKDLGRFKVVKRTAGVSTTDIIHRMLTGKYEYAMGMPPVSQMQMYATGPDGYAPWCSVYEGSLCPNKLLVKGDAQVESLPAVLISGDFDLFHMGHIEQLQRAKEVLYPGCRIVVGLHLDDTKTGTRTIMSLSERLLSILSCKYVDGVVVQPEMSGEHTSGWTDSLPIDDARLLEGGSFSYLTKQTIVSRVEDSRVLYVARNTKKGMVY